MAHEFESGFFVKQPAWHKKGLVINSAPQDTQEAMYFSGQDWDCQFRELFYEDRGERLTADIRAIVRENDGEMLGHCGRDYEIYQNREAHNQLAWPLVQSGFYNYETAISLRGGKVQCILLKQGETQILPLDVKKDYLLIRWSHDGSQKVNIKPVSIRVVCMNTLQIAMREVNELDIAVRHTRDMRNRLENVGEIFLSCKAAFEEQAVKLAAMSTEIVSEDWQRTGIKDVFGVSESTRNKNTMDSALNFVNNRQSGLDIPGVKNTRYGWFNGVSEFAEHVMNPKNKDRASRILDGTGAQLVNRAYQYASNN